MQLDSFVTVLIPTSPIPRHPKTDLIEECIGCIRSYLPSAKVIVMADGVRPSVEHRRTQYDEYKKELAKLVNELKLGRTEFRIFTDFSQQAIMTANTISHLVTTPLVMFVEHDAMLRKEPRINFEAIFDLLMANEANQVRLYSWAGIWHEHQHLMHGEFDYHGSHFVRTRQYSQWPLVSRTDYHARILQPPPKGHFLPGQRAMIETVMYSPVVESEWEKNKIVIYIDGQPTFTHRDGRTDETTGVRDRAEW